MSQRILAFSGRKQSGKDTCCNFLLRNRRELFGPAADVKKFSFAGPLKQFCIDYLGLRPEQVYGTDDEKNTLTHLRWEDLPHYAEHRDKVREAAFEEVFPGFAEGFDFASADPKDVREGVEKFNRLASERVRTGPMTAREVMQEVGTGVLRRMYDGVWVDKLVRDIRASGCHIALISDLRFPNELEAVHGAGGLVFRLTRNVKRHPTAPRVVPAAFNGVNIEVCCDGDTHPSERALDPDQYDWNNFDALVDNATHDIAWTNRAVASLLATRGWAAVPAPRTQRVLGSDLVHDPVVWDAA